MKEKDIFIKCIATHLTVKRLWLAYKYNSTYLEEMVVNTLKSQFTLLPFQRAAKVVWLGNDAQKPDMAE